MSPRLCCLLRWVPVLLSVLPTPGCLTVALWRTSGPDDLRVQVEQVSTTAITVRADSAVAGALQVEAANLLGCRGLLGFGRSAAVSCWRLRPRHESGEVMRILTGESDIAVSAARLEVVTEAADGVMMTRRATLALDGQRVGYPGPFQHSSSWEVELLETVDPTAPVLIRGTARLVWHDSRVMSRSWEGIVAKVALTPLTLAGDLALIGAFTCYLWLPALASPRRR